MLRLSHLPSSVYFFFPRSETEMIQIKSEKPFATRTTKDGNLVVEFEDGGKIVCNPIMAAVIELVLVEVDPDDLMMREIGADGDGVQAEVVSWPADRAPAAPAAPRSLPPAGQAQHTAPAAAPIVGQPSAPQGHVPFGTTAELRNPTSPFLTNDDAIGSHSGGVDHYISMYKNGKIGADALKNVVKGLVKSGLMSRESGETIINLSRPGASLGYEIGLELGVSSESTPARIPKGFDPMVEHKTTSPVSEVEGRIRDESGRFLSRQARLPIRGA